MDVYGGPSGTSGLLTAVAVQLAFSCAPPAAAPPAVAHPRRHFEAAKYARARKSRSTVDPARERRVPVTVAGPAARAAGQPGRRRCADAAAGGRLRGGAAAQRPRRTLRHHRHRVVPRRLDRLHWQPPGRPQPPNRHHDRHSELTACRLADQTPVQNISNPTTPRSQGIYLRDSVSVQVHV